MAFLLPTAVALAGTAATVATTMAVTNAMTPKQKGFDMPQAPSAGATEEQTRKEEMLKRARLTKTLLTGPQGTLGVAETGKKTLLGA